MPRLKILTVCERVIIDAQNQLPSLIGIFQKMAVRINPDVPIPENAVSPARWACFALWEHAEEELGIEFAQMWRIMKPNGDLFLENRSVFKIQAATDRQSKNTLDIFGVPISDQGTITVHTWLDGIEGSEARCEFQVEHQIVANQ
jgi:hypothetical protein